MSDTQVRRPYVMWAGLAVFVAALLVATGFVVGTRRASTTTHAYDDPIDTIDPHGTIDPSDTEPEETTTTTRQEVVTTAAPEPTTTARPTTTTTAAPAFDITSLIGTDYGSERFVQVMSAYGCREWFGTYYPGSYLRRGSGIDCRPGGIMISIAVTSTKVMSIGMVDEGYNGENFSQFEGPLPFGLRWGMTLTEANALLRRRFGAPVNHSDPAGGIVNYSMDDYVVTGTNFAGLQVQFDGDTERLQRVSASYDEPT